MQRIEANPKDRPSQMDYNRAHSFLTLVKSSDFLTPEEKMNLRHRALHGDLSGARREYAQLATGRVLP